MPTATPSTSTRSVSASTRRPSSATSPFTDTRPSAISSSLARRLAIPAWASTFWSFSVGTQGVLERLHHLRSRHEVAQRRQVVDRVQAELLEEEAGGPVEERLPRPGIAGDLLDVAALLEGAH